MTGMDLSPAAVQHRRRLAVTWTSRGFTAKEAAVRVGVNPRTVARYLRQEREETR